MIKVDILDKLKSTICGTNDLVGLLLMHNDGFSKWYNDKFLKYDGYADYEDQRVLNESINTALQELAKGSHKNHY